VLTFAPEANVESFFMIVEFKIIEAFNADFVGVHVISLLEFVENNIFWQEFSSS
jgi:hypothetical protein